MPLIASHESRGQQPPYMQVWEEEAHTYVGCDVPLRLEKNPGPRPTSTLATSPCTTATLENVNVWKTFGHRCDPYRISNMVSLSATNTFLQMMTPILLARTTVPHAKETAWAFPGPWANGCDNGTLDSRLRQLTPMAQGLAAKRNLRRLTCQYRLPLLLATPWLYTRAWEIHSFLLERLQPATSIFRAINSVALPCTVQFHMCKSRCLFALLRRSAEHSTD